MNKMKQDTYDLCLMYECNKLRLVSRLASAGMVMVLQTSLQLPEP